MTKAPSAPFPRTRGSASGLAGQGDLAMRTRDGHRFTRRDFIANGSALGVASLLGMPRTASRQNHHLKSRTFVSIKAHSSAMPRSYWRRSSWAWRVSPT